MQVTHISDTCNDTHIEVTHANDQCVLLDFEISSSICLGSNVMKIVNTISIVLKLLSVNYFHNCFMYQSIIIVRMFYHVLLI